MKLFFSKYQGAGNDFILLDNRKGEYDALSIEQIKQLCNRRFGIGADGLIKINSHPTFHFEVDYYNADGSKSFCGNGGRCAVSFCNKLGMDVNTSSFLGFDGEHKATFENDIIQLQMNPVCDIQLINADFEIYTGSPHYIHFSNDIADLDMYSFGKSIRYNDHYKKEGINVNMVQELAENYLFVRTYERGVENETLACGTGVTACAIAYSHKQHKVGENHIKIKVMGGELAVRFDYDGNCFTNVWLIGPGTFVFDGTTTI